MSWVLNDASGCGLHCAAGDSVTGTDWDWLYKSQVRQTLIGSVQLKLMLWPQ